MSLPKRIVINVVLCRDLKAGDLRDGDRTRNIVIASRTKGFTVVTQCGFVLFLSEMRSDTS